MKEIKEWEGMKERKELVENGIEKKQKNLINFKMFMLFSQSDSLVLLAPTISGMKVFQPLGHCCLIIF